jgi:hypothetical protein
MRCLGCDLIIKTSCKRAESWDIWQICPKCFDELVPTFYRKDISARIKVTGR